MKALIIYYSLTKQAERVANAIAGGLRKESCDVVLKEIELAEPYIFPFKSPLDFFKISLDMWRGEKIEIKPMNIDAEQFDLVVLGSQTWWLSPSLPISALLSKEESRTYFEGKNVAVFVVCRGAWQRNLSIVLEKLRRLGAHIVDTIALQHQGREPGRFLTLAAYHVFGKEFTPSFLKKLLYPYGLGEGELAQAEQFGRKLGRLLERGKK